MGTLKKVMMKKVSILLILLAISFLGFSQDDEDSQKSVIQEYTPSILLKKGQWDIKWFNNLYTQTKSTFSDGKEPRQTFFTSTVDIFTGISDSNNFNVGLLLKFRSNVVADRDALDVFSFDGERGTARSGFTSFAPAIKFNPIKSISNFTIQTAFHIPLVDNEVEEGVKVLLLDKELLKKMQEISKRVVGLQQYMTETKTPICVISVDKKKSQQKLIKKLESLKKHIKLLVIVDHENNDLSDPYMLIWRVVNNIDATRDVVLEPFIAIDGTNKSEVDGYEREWPGDTFCSKEVLDMLQEKGIIDIDEKFIKKFGLLPF